MTMSAEVLTLWDFDDPAGSRARFEAAAESETDPGRRLVWLTQAARAHGLAGEFAEAHAVLDGLDGGGHEGGRGGSVGGGEGGRGGSVGGGDSEALRDGQIAGDGGGGLASSGLASSGLASSDLGGSGRVALERGRVLRSSGDVDGSIPLFRKAFDDCMAAGERGLAADAAHMLAIVLPDQHEEWARRGLEVAEGSDDPLAWAMTGALLNNLAWKLADEERWAEAYELFDRAVPAREAVVAQVSGKAPAGALQAARWSRARAARALGRNEEALAELRELDQSDPYVQEELKLLS